MESRVKMVTFAASRRGGVAAITALMLPVFIGSAGLTSDMIQLVFIKRVMQRQADSGAISGAFALSQGFPAAATVTTDLPRNSNYPLTVAPVIENAPTTGTYAGNTRAVRVVLATDAHLPFIGFFISAERITAEATAAIVGQGEYCVVGLDPTASTTINMTSNTTLNMGCGMVSNSPAANSISAGGSSNVTASAIAAVGSLSDSSHYATGTELIPYSIPQTDPYANLPTPTVVGSATSVIVNPFGVLNLLPGIYSGMTVKGTLNLAPGTYVIDGGTLNLSAQAVINGTGVTFVLTSRTASFRPSSIATITINGGAQWNVTAPTSGTYAGVLMYQDRRAVDGGSNIMNGNSSSILQGALYFPSQELQFQGTVGMNIKCIKLVAKRFTFTGNSTITNVCPPNSGVASILGTHVKLVG
jgi:hypothetical protein